jgi:hypothetical protein
LPQVNGLMFGGQSGHDGKDGGANRG